MTQIPGQHVPMVKNRSSKHLIQLTKVKPAVKSASNAMLEAWAASNAAGVHKELKRRQKKPASK